MSRFLRHGLYSIGAFVMMMIVLTGCTDAMIGPEESGATNDRVVEMADGTPLHHTNPLDAVESDGDGPTGRLVYRNSAVIVLPPDSTGGGGAPTSRLVYRNSVVIFPPDSTGGPSPIGGGR